jgi:uncharacterized membrane protein YccC
MVRFSGRLKTLDLSGRAALVQACRVVVAAALALSAAEVLHLNLPLWSVLTALVVTQISGGKSLKATVDYLIGTLSGAAFGVVVALLVPNPGPGALVGVLAMAIAPMAVLAAWLPSFAIAPATAAIVILLPAMTHATPAASALDRILEVAVGAAIGLAVSFVPPRPKAAPPQRAG